MHTSQPLGCSICGGVKRVYISGCFANFPARDGSMSGGDAASSCFSFDSPLNFHTSEKTECSEVGKILVFGWEITLEVLCSLRLGCQYMFILKTEECPVKFEFYISIRFILVFL